MSRLIAVLGYSDSHDPELHPVCAARLERAELEAEPQDIVLFSGWARGRDASSEADLMARRWRAPVRKRVVDRGARTTLGNAVAVGRAVRQLGMGEVVLVTSSWHARRAAVLARAALAGSGATLRLATSSEPTRTGRRLRELASWTIVPVLVVVAMRTR